MPLLFAYGKNRFSHDVAPISIMYASFHLGGLFIGLAKNSVTVMILNFRIDRFRQTVYTHWPDQTAPEIRVYTVCHSVCIFWSLCSMVKPHCSNFRVITAKFFRCQNVYGTLFQARP